MSLLVDLHIGNTKTTGSHRGPNNYEEMKIEKHGSVEVVEGLWSESNGDGDRKRALEEEKGNGGGDVEMLKRMNG
jgi:hypothetical protein